LCNKRRVDMILHPFLVNPTFIEPALVGFMMRNALIQDDGTRDGRGFVIALERTRLRGASTSWRCWDSF
jgi:hypothetical protein